MKKINKFSLPAVILIASVILGGFFYASQVNKQRSIERQQEAKAEQEKKEYIAKRKNECYSLYEKEREKWSNVKDFRYSEVRDVCIVKYKSDKPAKTKEECEIFKDTSGLTNNPFGDVIFDEYSNCLENWFSKEF